MGAYQVRQIDEHTWQIEDLFHTYMYLLEGEEKAVLFDCGNGFPGLKKLVGTLTDKPVEVLLSHGHFDHTGCAAEFSLCSLHLADLQVLREGFDAQGRKEQCDFFEKLYGVALSAVQREYFLQAKAPDGLHFVKGGELIDLGGRILEIIETPGHTKGSIAALDRTKRALFSGDAVCDNEILVYFDHSATVQDVKSSDKRMLEKREFYDRIWPGHHRCPLETLILEDYIEAAERVIQNPRIGTYIPLEEGYKILYQYKTIGISYREDRIR